ncbi:hypothetical protein GCM10027403_11650 [Arthrobacter tecti]
MIGLLIATELLMSFAARFPAGLLADVRERRSIAAAGAALFGISCAGYAFATGPYMAFGSAVIGGLGGALFWVSLRAIVSETVASDSASFSRLMAWQETGSWVAFVAGLTLIGSLDFRGVFLAASIACLIAALTLIFAPRRHTPPDRTAQALSTRRVGPMLIATAVTSLAEAAIGLLLLLHLQSAFNLNVVSIALVFLPGAIVMSLMPGPAHRLTFRIGRRRVASIAAVSSAAFAVSLGFVPSPALIAALWILSAGAWAAIIPIEQSVIAEVSGERAGKGFGLYESARLAGAGAGAVLAGVSYETTNWQVACFLFGFAIATGAIITPWAIQRSGAENFPRNGESMQTSDPDPTERGNFRTSDRVPGKENVEARTVTTVRMNRSKLTGLVWHLIIFAGAQVVLALTGWSWIIDSFSTRDFSEHVVSGGRPDLEGVPSLIYSAGKIWVIIFIIDVTWTLAAAGKKKQVPEET